MKISKPNFNQFILKIRIFLNFSKFFLSLMIVRFSTLFQLLLIAKTVVLTSLLSNNINLAIKQYTIYFLF